MKLRRLEFKDNAEGEAVPAVVSVDMTIEEAALLAKMAGNLNGITKEEILPGYVDEPNSIYDCLVGDVFNRYWEDGVDDYVRSR